MRYEVQTYQDGSMWIELGIELLNWWSKLLYVLFDLPSSKGGTIRNRHKFLLYSQLHELVAFLLVFLCYISRYRLSNAIPELLACGMTFFVTQH